MQLQTRLVSNFWIFYQQEHQIIKCSKETKIIYQKLAYEIDKSTEYEPAQKGKRNRQNQCLESNTSVEVVKRSVVSIAIARLSDG